jgi:hypothetical protein
MNKYKLHAIKALIITLCISGIQVDSYGQEYLDLLKTWYTTSPGNEYEDSDGESDIKTFGLDVTLPFPLKNGNAIITGLQYEQTELDLNPAKFNPNSFSYTILRLGMNIKHKNNWDGTYILMPRLSSDDMGFQSRDFQLGGLLLWKYTKNTNFKYKLGAYYNGEIESPFMLPLFGMYYLSENRKFEMNLTLPVTADFNYRWNDWFATGLEFYAMSNSYAIHDPIFQSEDEYLNREIQNLSLYTQFTVNKSFVLQAKVGTSIGRDFRIHKDGEDIDFRLPLVYIGDNREQLNPKYSDGLFFSVTARYRYFLDK